MKINLVFGSSGTIGLSLYKTINNQKNIVFYSNKKFKKFKKWNLNKSLRNFPIKNIENCYFLASPRILNKNFKKKVFSQEISWLKNVIKNLKIKKLIYLSSSSVYYNKNHIIGSAKRKCEKIIINNSKKFQNYQIWRPFNLVGYNHIYSDHFYNLLYKKMFIRKQNKSDFFGSSNDLRGFSDVNDFVKILLKFSSNNITFIKDYGNLDLISCADIVKLFNKYYFKINKKKFIVKFKSQKKNINGIKIKKNNIYYKKKSIKVLENYLKSRLSEKKM